jgi:hypothetical protein
MVVEPVPPWRGNQDGSKPREQQRRKFLETIGQNARNLLGRLETLEEGLPRNHP